MRQILVIFLVFYDFMEVISTSMAITSMRVGIIGGGASGLAMGVILKEKNIPFTIYEKLGHVGGVWKYKSKSNLAKSVNPMYENLRTNLPVEIMAFHPQYRFLPKQTSYLKHQDVQNYLENYATDYDIMKYIRFYTEVISLSKDITMNKWKIVSSFSLSTSSLIEEQQCKDRNHITEDYYDYIVVCNGHFNKPYTPNIKGIEYFQGQQIHSIDYDNSQPFKGRKVLVVGTKSSGTDIARDISLVAARIYVCSRQAFISSEIQSEPKIIVKPSIDHVDTLGDILFTDGTKECVDCIVWCTGYQYYYSFLEREQKQQQEQQQLTTFDPYPKVQVIHGRAVQPLYYQIFSIDDPSLMFMGLPYTVIPFPLFHLQACWIASVIDGSCVLPSLKDRQQWFEKDFQSKRHDIQTYHFLGGPPQFIYMRYMAKQAGIYTEDLEKYLNMLEEIYNDSSKNKPIHPGGIPTYRERRYSIDWNTMTWSVMSIPTTALTSDIIE